MENEFLHAVEKNRFAFELEFETEMLEKLAFYYQQIREANAILHLTAPSSAEEFAVRHILESLWLEKFFPSTQNLFDIGAGGGLPSIPLLIKNGEWKGNLIESKPKKAEFLRKIIEELELQNRASVSEKQFAEAFPPQASDLVTCRALDKFTTHLKKLLKWSGTSSKAFFGGESLRDELKKKSVKFEEKLLPLSEKRFIFLLKNQAWKVEKMFH